MREHGEFVGEQSVAFSEAAAGRNDIGAVADHAVQPAPQAAYVDGVPRREIGRIIFGK